VTRQKKDNYNSKVSNLKLHIGRIEKKKILSKLQIKVNKALRAALRRPIAKLRDAAAYYAKLIQIWLNLNRN